MCNPKVSKKFPSCLSQVIPSLQYQTPPFYDPKYVQISWFLGDVLKQRILPSPACPNSGVIPEASGQQGFQQGFFAAE